MSESIFTDYYTTNFSEVPEESYTWRYQIRDMLDEWIFEGLAVALFAAVYFGGNGNIICNWIAYIGWCCCGIAALGIIGVIILRRYFMKFKLTPDHFEYTSGLFTQKVETFQLSDIIEIDLRRSWWERIIKTGTIIIHFKNGMESQTNPLMIRGIGKYEDMFKYIDYYRNHHRMVLYFGI